MADLDRVVIPSGRQEWSTGLPADTRAVARARHDVRELLTSWKLLCLLDDAELVTSELVTNMVRHAATPADLRVRWDGTCLRIAVEDARLAVPLPRQAGDGRVRWTGAADHRRGCSHLGRRSVRRRQGRLGRVAASTVKCWAR